jgi:hypothetical protein
VSLGISCPLAQKSQVRHIAAEALRLLCEQEEI